MMTTTPILYHCTATDQSINCPHYDAEEEVWEEFNDHSVEDPQWNVPHYSTAAMLGVNEGETYCTDIGRLVTAYDNSIQYGYIEE